MTRERFGTVSFSVFRQVHGITRKPFLRTEEPILSGRDGAKCSSVNFQFLLFIKLQSLEWSGVVVSCI